MAEQGGHPLAFFNNKPPGIYFWYRACFALFGNGPLACHLTSTIPDLIVLLAVSVVGRRLASAAVGNAAAAIYATLQPAVRLAGYGYTESPLTACLLVGAAVVATRPGYPTRRASAFVAGVLFGTATLFKQPGYLLGSALAAWGIARIPSTERVRWAVALGLGVILTQLGLVGWLARHGVLVEFVERVFVQGARHGYADGFDIATRVREWLSIGFAPMPALATLGVAALSSPRSLATRGLAVALVVPTVAIGGVSYEFYDHYLIPALPALALVVAEWLGGMEPRGIRVLACAGLAAVQACSLAVYAFGEPLAGAGSSRVFEVWRRRPLSLGYQLRVAAFVAEATAPDEPILSTGSDIPYLAGRRNAYRFLGVAPYLRRLDTVGFDDFPATADRVRILVLERWRLALLPAGWVAGLESPDSGWSRVVALDHPEFVVYRRVGFPPTIGNP